MASTAPTNDKSPVLKALRLLAHVAASSEPPTLAELSRAMQLPKPTTYRLARALESAGFVRKDPLTLRYQIGTAFENVALSGLRNSAAHGTRRLLMNQLAEQLGARVNLVVLKAGNLAFVQWVESTAPLRVEIRGDLPMPVHCSASGKLLLAFGPVELREGVFRSAPFAATRRTPSPPRAAWQRSWMRSASKATRSTIRSCCAASTVSLFRCTTGPDRSWQGLPSWRRSPACPSKNSSAMCPISRPAPLEFRPSSV